MKDPNLLEDLVAVSPGMEIWWDSSPVIFGNWCKKMLAKADAGDRANLECQFARMYDVGHPMDQLFRGVTTNPPLSLAAIKDDPARWQKVAGQTPGVSANDWTDESVVEGVVGQSILNGVPVQVYPRAARGNELRVAS